MRINDASAWEDFIYALVYPAVLGSMVYDLLQFGFPPKVPEITSISVAALYCLDYLHLRNDLRLSNGPHRSLYDVSLDGLVAILFGGAYWRVSHSHLTSGYATLVLLCLVGAIYNCISERRQLGSLTVYGLLGVIAC